MPQTDAATDRDAPAPVLRVIAELKSLVAERVDELRSQILTLGRADAFAEPSPAPNPPPAHEPPPAAPSFLAPGEAMAMAAETESRTPRSTSAATAVRDTPSSDRPPPGRPTTTPNANPTPASEPATAPRDDPRQRLEALARLLDRKAKTTSTPGPGNGTG